MRWILQFVGGTLLLALVATAFTGSAGAGVFVIILAMPILASVARDVSANRRNAAHQDRLRRSGTADGIPYAGGAGLGSGGGEGCGGGFDGGGGFGGGDGGGGGC